MKCDWCGCTISGKVINVSAGSFLFGDNGVVCCESCKYAWIEAHTKK